MQSSRKPSKEEQEAIRRHYQQLLESLQSLTMVLSTYPEPTAMLEAQFFHHIHWLIRTHIDLSAMRQELSFKSGLDVSQKHSEN